MPGISRDDVVGVILAGGAARRMDGRDKALLPLGGGTLLGHVVDRLRPQVGRLVLNANGDPARFDAFGLPVIADANEERAGPLAGILAGLEWAAANAPSARWIMTAPADTPFFPRDALSRFAAAVGGTRQIAVARSKGAIHAVAALVPFELRNDLAKWLAGTTDLAVRAWLRRHPAVMVDFPDSEGTDPFVNVNTPDDLKRAEGLLARRDQEA
jgi:molybdopterin-guanine dinucleotide biosynthesis protein A